MNQSLTVGIVQWAPGDGVSLAIGEALSRLGHKPTLFHHDGRIPADVDVVLTFAPYGSWLQIPAALGSVPKRQRPLLVHWDFESIPNPRLPWFFVRILGSWRSRLDFLNTDPGQTHQLMARLPLTVLLGRMHKFRYVGDYLYAYHEGWLDLLLETSKVYAAYHCRHRLPASYVPWGTPKRWHADLGLERDIDVLWFGKRRTKRRSRLLDQVRRELSAYGVSLYVADNVEKPFVFGDERTRLLNRAKVTLNLLPTSWDNAFPFRFNTAAGNRSLVISEPFLPHCPIYESGKHYVVASAGQLTETILRYLKDDEERSRIAENAHALVTTELTLENSIRRIMDLVASRVGS